MQPSDIPWDMTPIEDVLESRCGPATLAQLHSIGIYLAGDLPRYTIEDILSCDRVGPHYLQEMRNFLRENRVDFLPSEMRKSGRHNKHRTHTPREERAAAYQVLVERARQTVWCYGPTPEWSPHHGQSEPLKQFADRCRRDAAGKSITHRDALRGAHKAE